MGSQLLYKLRAEQEALNSSPPKPMDSQGSSRWTAHSILPGTSPVLKLETPSPRKASCEGWSSYFLRNREMNWRKNIHSSTILPHTTIKANPHMALLAWRVLAPCPFPCLPHQASDASSYKQPLVWSEGHASLPSLQGCTCRKEGAVLLLRIQCSENRRCLINGDWVELNY